MCHKFVGSPGTMEGADNTRPGSEPNLQKQHGLRRGSLLLPCFCLSLRARRSSPAATGSAQHGRRKKREKASLSATKNNKVSTFPARTLLYGHGWSEHTQRICQVPPAPSPARSHRQQIKNQIRSTCTVKLLYGHFSRVPENPIKHFPAKAGEQLPCEEGRFIVQPPGHLGGG